MMMSPFYRLQLDQMIVVGLFQLNYSILVELNRELDSSNFWYNFKSVSQDTLQGANWWAVVPVQVCLYAFSSV